MPVLTDSATVAGELILDVPVGRDVARIVETFNAAMRDSVVTGIFADEARGRTLLTLMRDGRPFAVLELTLIDTARRAQAQLWGYHPDAPALV